MPTLTVYEMQNAAVLLCLAFGLEAIAHEPSACLDFCTSEVEEVCVWSFSPRTYLNPCHARCEGNRNYIQGNCTAAREEQRHLGRSYVPGRALFSAPAPPANQAEPQEPHLVTNKRPKLSKKCLEISRRFESMPPRALLVTVWELLELWS